MLQCSATIPLDPFQENFLFSWQKVTFSSENYAMCQTLAQVFDTTSQTNKYFRRQWRRKITFSNPSRLWFSFVLASWIINEFENVVYHNFGESLISSYSSYSGNSWLFVFCLVGVWWCTWLLSSVALLSYTRYKPSSYEFNCTGTQDWY